MAVTENFSSYYDASVTEKIYLVLGTGGEWDKYHQPNTRLSKPKILTKGKATKGLLTDNVKNPRIGTDDNGVVAFSGRELSVNDAMVFMPFTPSEWKDNFPTYQPSGTSVDLKQNPKVMKGVLDLTKAMVNEEIADLEAQGDTTAGAASPLRFTDGLIKLMAADGDVVDFANIGVITKTNVLGIITAMEKLIPKRLRTTSKRSRVKFAMSFNTFDLAQDANRETQQNATFLQTADFFKTPKGFEMVPFNSMPDNTIFVTIMGTGSDSNLHKGTWFENDESNYSIYKEQKMDEDWVIGLKFSIGFNYSAGEDIVLYQGS